MANTQPLGGIIIGNSIKVDNRGNTYVTGNFEETADFDPGTGTANLTSAGGSSIFIAKYNASGNYVYAKAVGFTGGARDFFSASSIAIDPAGNVYITGKFGGTGDFDPGPGVVNLTSSGGTDIFFAKYDVSGNYVYAKILAGGYDDIGNSIAVDNLGNAYVTGSFGGTVDFDPGPGTANLSGGPVFFAKYDASGAYVYAYSIGASYVSSIVGDHIGNIYLTGYSYNGVDFDPGPGVALNSDGVYFAKYDASGAYVYARSIRASSASSIVNDDMGNIYIAGNFNGTVDFDPGPGVAYMIADYGCYIARYDVAGNYVYAKAIAGTFELGVTAIALGANSNIFITGTFSETVDFDPGPGISNLATNSFPNIFVASYNVNGTYLFAKSIGGIDDAFCQLHGNSMAVDGSGNSYITGSFEGIPDFDPGAGTATLDADIRDGTNAFVLKLSVAGNYVWANQLGNYTPVNWLLDEGSAIAVDASGNSLVTGSFSGTIDFDPGPGTAYVTSNGLQDIFIAKFDPSGNLLFAKGIGGTQDDRGNGIAVDGSGNVYFTGSFTETVDFDPGPGVVNFTAGSQCVLFAKYDPLGNYLYARTIAWGNASALVVTSTGEVYLTGFCSGTVDFDPGAGVANLSGDRFCFVAKYDPAGNYVYARGIYPDRDGPDGYSSYAEAKGIAVDGLGNAFITGSLHGTADFDPGPGVVNISSDEVYLTDGFLAKYGPTGSFVYANLITGTGAGECSGIAVDNSGNTFITGVFYGVADFDPGSGTANLNGPGNMFLARYDASGNYVYAKSFDGSAAGVGNGIAVDGSGTVYATGNSGDKGFFTKYDSGGNYVYAKNFTRNSPSGANAIALDTAGNVYVIGGFSGIANFDEDWGSANAILTASYGSDIFIAKYDPTLLVTYTFTGNGNWNIPSNWLNNNIPPDTIAAGQHVIINPVLNGACILEKPLTVRLGAKLTVAPNAKLEIRK